MQDRLFARIKHFQNVISVGTGVEEVANVQRLEMLITVQLLIISICDRLELCLILRGQNSFCISPKI